MCAEMLDEVEHAHAATYYAAWALDAGAEDRAIAAAVAKSFVSEAARKVCGDAIQVHGGIGFTWEFDLHFFFKRAKHYEPLWGDADYHRERIFELWTASQAGERPELAGAAR
jgi:alkylation response protein AidB-like acyl-CoA dehydrogenase